MPLAMMSPLQVRLFLPSQSLLTEPAPRGLRQQFYRHFGGHAEHTFRSVNNASRSKPGESSASDPSVRPRHPAFALQFSAGYVRSDHIQAVDAAGIFCHVAANGTGDCEEGSGA